MLSVASFASASPGATVLSGNAASTPLPTWQNAYDWPAGHGYFGFVQTADRSGYGFSQGSPSGAGLWLWPQGAQRYERGGAQWSYAAPGTTRILKATVRISYKPRLLSHHCVRASLSDGSDQRDSVVFCKPPGPPAGTGDVEIRLGDPAPNPTAGKLSVRIEVACAEPDPGACQKQIPASDAERAGLHTSLVDMTLVDDDDPTLYPGGVWYDLRDRYVDGRETHGLWVRPMRGRACAKPR
jgi:hypothetical protein